MQRLAVTAWILVIPILWIAAAQEPLDDHMRRTKMARQEALLKDEYKKSLEDSAELSKLAEELKIELEKNDHNVLSLAAVKKTEEIEKLAKRIRGRLRRF
jgi:hypothetical protein